MKHGEKGIGKRLKLCRIGKDYTLEAVAKKVGVTATYISLIERNKNKPNRELMDKLSELYDMDRDELYEAYGVYPAPLEAVLEDETLRKALTAIGNDERLTDEDKKNLYDRLEYWYKKTVEERE